MLSDVEHWDLEVVSAVLATFAGTIAMWWLYFGISSHDATEAITHAKTPDGWGQLPLCACIADRRHHRHRGGQRPGDGSPGSGDAGICSVLVAGPLIYLLGGALYKRVVYGRAPYSHLFGAMALVVLGVVLPHSHLAAGWLTSAVLLAVGLMDTRLKRRLQRA